MRPVAILTLAALALARAAHAAPAPKPRSPAAAPAGAVLPASALEGIYLSERGMKPHGPAIIRCGVDVRNNTPYVITALTLRLDLYTPTPGGERLAQQLTYTVPAPGGPMPPNPDADIRFHSPMMSTRLPPDTPFSGYYIVLVSARGYRAPYAPHIAADEKYVYASARGDLDTLRAMTPPPAIDPRSRLPLCEAARCNHPAVARWLLAHGARVNARDPWGQTPLFYACLRGSASVARVLLQNGADIHVKAHDGQDLLAWEEAQADQPGAGDAAQVLQLLQNADRR